MVEHLDRLFCYLFRLAVLEKVNDRHQQSHLNELLVKLNFNGYYGSD